LWRRACRRARHCVQRVQVDFLAGRGQQHSQSLQRVRAEKGRRLQGMMDRHEQHAHGIVAGVGSMKRRSRARVESRLVGGMSCH